MSESRREKQTSSIGIISHIHWIEFSSFVVMTHSCFEIFFLVCFISFFFLQFGLDESNNHGVNNDNDVFLTGVNSAGGLFVSAGFDALVSFLVVLVVLSVSILECGSTTPLKSKSRTVLKIFIIFGFLSSLKKEIDGKR